MGVPGGARFLIALLTAFSATVVVLGGAGYAVSRVAVSPMPDVFRTAAFELELAPGWWCELDGSEYVCSPPGKPPHAAIAVIAMKEPFAIAHFRAVMNTGTVSPKLKELTIVRTSQLNGCEY